MFSESCQCGVCLTQFDVDLLQSFSPPVWVGSSLWNLDALIFRLYSSGCLPCACLLQFDSLAMVSQPRTGPKITGSTIDRFYYITTGWCYAGDWSVCSRPAAGLRRPRRSASLASAKWPLQSHRSRRRLYRSSPEAPQVGTSNPTGPILRHSATSKHLSRGTAPAHSIHTRGAQSRS